MALLTRMASLLMINKVTFFAVVVIVITTNNIMNCNAFQLVPSSSINHPSLLSTKFQRSITTAGSVVITGTSTRSTPSSTSLFATPTPTPNPNPIIKTNDELKTIFDACPFTKEKKGKSYFTILHSIPNSELVEIASKKVYEGEEYLIINDCIYYFYEKGYGQAKFNMNLFERKLKTASTSRNYRTMLKLLSLSSELN